MTNTSIPPKASFLRDGGRPALKSINQIRPMTTAFPTLQLFLYIYIYDLVPKGAYARGYALQLKIKHCWKLFLFKMLCCVLAWINEYTVRIISATRLWLISRYSHHTLKKWLPKTDIHVPSDFRHFAYKQTASTWSNNLWFVRRKHRFIRII